MVFYIGKDILKEALKTYFVKYKFQNTNLMQFIAELNAASVRLGHGLDFKRWS